MGGIDQDATEAAHANQLYWESGQSVNQIADELGISKGALYELITPLASPWGCPLCAAPLHYAHRTAHEKGVVTCSGCGTQFEDSDPQLGEAPDLAPDAPISSPAPVYVPRGRQEGHPPAQVLVGTAVLGVGVGLLLARIFGRR